MDGQLPLTDAQLALITQQVRQHLQQDQAEKDIKVPFLEKVGSAEWLEWRQTFERICALKGYDNAQRKRLIIAKMRGPVVAAVANIPHDALDADGLLRAYEEKFVTAAGATYARQQFRQAKQEREETLTAFHTRLITLYRHAHPNANLETTPELIERFTFGLHNRTVQEYVSDHSPLTMTDALRYANIKQATVQAMGASGSKAVNNIDALTPTDHRNLRCYNCQQMGHISRNCRRPRQQNNRGRGAPRGRGRGRGFPNNNRQNQNRNTPNTRGNSGNSNFNNQSRRGQNFTPRNQPAVYALEHHPEGDDNQPDSDDQDPENFQGRE
jgi:hypothetical protein